MGALAERKRQVVRDEISSVALRLLAVRGFDGTTIDQIAAEAGVSRRTFFRYFKSKEDVVIEALDEHGGRVVEELAARPADESSMVALRRSLSLLVTTFCEYPDKTLGLTRLVFGSASLRGRYLDRQRELQAALAAELARRQDRDPGVDLRPALAAGVALTAFDVALDRWSRGDGSEDLGELLDRAFSSIAVE